jgi:phage shock protein PspC (stress-responsive transcriptional regulator)
MSATEATVAPAVAHAGDRPPFGRRPGNHLVAGVASGLADWLGLPPWGVRFFLLFLLPVLLPSGFWFLGLYGAAALLMPAAGQRRPGWDNLAALLRVGALVLIFSSAGGGSLFLFASGDPISFWLPQNILGLVALVLVLVEAQRPWQPQRDQIVVLAAAPFVLCGTFLVAGIWLAPDVEWQRFVPIVPVAAGGALLIAARSKAGTALLAPAVVAVAITGTVVASGAQLRGGVGDVTVRPRTAAEVPARLQRAAGDVNIDLSKLEPSRKLIVIRASVGAGDLGLMLPHGLRLDIDARVGRGRIADYALQGNSTYGSEGFDLKMKDRGLKAGIGPVRPPARNRLKLLANVGLGELRIETPDNFGGHVP